MSAQEFVDRLSRLDTSDPEHAHDAADDILLAALSEAGYGAVVLAYRDVVQRCDWWATA